MSHDLRYALRLIRKNPGAALTAVLTLAMCVGANAAIFSVIRALLLKPPVYADPERLVLLNESWPSLPGPRPASKQDFRDWVEQNTVFDQIAAVSWGDATVSEGNRPAYVPGALVSPSYFEVFGLHAALGRTFAPDEDQPGRAHVVVLSHRIWVSQFGSDPRIVGKSIRLDSELYTVIGVMPAGTNLRLFESQLWRPLTFDTIPPRGYHDLQEVVAKLKPGVSFDHARSEMNAIAGRLARAYPESNKGYGVVMQQYPRPLGFDVESSLYILFGAVTVVLLIGCVNLANLALARSAARVREVAIRIALGARRGRLLRQFLIEHVVVGLLGGVAGIVVGYVVLAGLKAVIPTTGLRAAFPPDTVISMDPLVWTFALMVGLLSGIAFGLAPAIGATRLTLAEAIKSAGSAGIGTGRRQGRFQRLLVASEVALSFVLVSGSALLMQSFFVLTHRIEAGFESTNVLTGGLPMPETRFDSGQALNRYLDEIARRVQALPGIREVAFADAVPTEGTPYGKLFQIVGQATVPYSSRPLCGFKVVSPSYFRAVGLRLIEGRVLTDDDRDGAPLVLVINQTMARRYSPGTDPIGQRLLMKRYPMRGAEMTGDLTWTIVGVTADEGVSPFDTRTPEPAVYATREQHPRRNLALVVRTTSDPARVQEPIRKTVSAFDRDQALADLKTLEQRKADDVAPDRLRSILLGTLALIAVVLAAIGLYGVISLTVTQRTRELGIRAALGATEATLIRHVLRQAFSMIGLGLVAGIGAASVVTRVLRTLLYGVEPSDPTTLAAVAAILTGVALVASYIPSRRATRIDPLLALKSE